MKSIIVLLGAIMLLACKNDIKEVNALAEREKRPDMTGENLELVYSDSARIKYRVLAPEYIKVNREKEKYEERNMPKSWKMKCFGRRVMKW